MSTADKLLQALANKIQSLDKTTPVLGRLTRQDLGRMSFDELSLLRDKYKGVTAAQEVLAPYEHGAFARKLVAEKPWMALAMPGAVQGYQLTKALVPQRGLEALGLSEPGAPATSPSAMQLMQGLSGTAQGLADAFQKGVKGTSRAP